MAYVTHTVDIVYGSYSEKGYEVVCDENDDLDSITSKVRKRLSLNFLPMSHLSVKITNTENRPDDY
jgi:hypothetical protein